MSGNLDSQKQTSNARLIGNNRIGYGVLCGASVVGAFALSAAFGAFADASILVLVCGVVLYGLFNLAGVLRPKWLLLSPEGLRYRPVIGRERFIGWRDIKSVDYVFISQGTGVLTYRDRFGRAHGLGLWFDTPSLVQSVEDWRIHYS
jgi:hypothetical protein